MENEELDIDKPLRFERKRELRRTFYDLIQHDVAQIVRRIHGDGVAAVHTRTLDVLHDAGDEHVLTVADDIDLQLLPHEILIAEHGVFDVLGENDVHVSGNIALRKRDGHVLTADDIRRTEQDGIAELVGGRQRLLFGLPRCRGCGCPSCQDSCTA